jgi:hypothetical protein
VIKIIIPLISQNPAVMKQFIFLSLFLILGIALFSQEKKMNQAIPDPKSNHNMMIGYCTLAGITDIAFDSAFKVEYSAYAPDKEIIDQVSSLLNEVTITIVMGSWCEDSQKQVPRFMKVLNNSDPSFPEPVLICVDRDKKAGDVSLEGMNILKVPTIIIYHHKRELGRIIETPETTLESDFLFILKKQL